MQKTVNVMDHAHEDVKDVLRCMSDGEWLRVDAIVTGNWVRNDYGVPGSPVWWDIDDLAVDTFEINGVDMTPKEAEAKFGKAAVDALWEMAVDAADTNEGWDE